MIAEVEPLKKYYISVTYKVLGDWLPWYFLRTKSVVISFQRQTGAIGVILSSEVQVSVKVGDGVCRG